MQKPLKQIRKEQGKTQEYIAAKLEVSKSHYCNIENGKRRLHYEDALKIAEILGVPIQDIIFLPDALSKCKQKKMGTQQKEAMYA